MIDFGLEDIAAALHRKLLNINQDIRKALKNKATKEDIRPLVASKKAVDYAYSTCIVAMLRNNPEERERVYQAALVCYKKH